CSLRRGIAGAVMSACLRRMAARLWPASLFGRLAIILFSGLVAAHVLAFVLIVVDRAAIANELSDEFAIADIADSVAILDHVTPEKSPAWLDRLARPDYRYILGDLGGERQPEAGVPKHRQRNLARFRARLGPGHDANLVYLDPPARSRLGI